MFHVELTNDNDSQPANENHYHRANENHYHRPNENHYHLGKSARPRQWQFDKFFLDFYAEICDCLFKLGQVFYSSSRRGRARVKSQCESEQFTRKFVTNWGRYSQSFLRTRNNYFGATAPVQCQCDFD